MRRTDLYFLICAVSAAAPCIVVVAATVLEAAAAACGYACCRSCMGVCSGPDAEWLPTLCLYLAIDGRVSLIPVPLFLVFVVAAAVGGIAVVTAAGTAAAAVACGIACFRLRTGVCSSPDAE